MSVPLRPETIRLIEERMKRGGYASPDDVVCAGLASLDQQESLENFEPGEMEALIAEGERSGEPLDGEQVLAELRELRKRNQSKAG